LFASAELFISLLCKFALHLLFYRKQTHRIDDIISVQEPQLMLTNPRDAMLDI